jgi:hypothetical protein
VNNSPRWERSPRDEHKILEQRVTSCDQLYEFSAEQIRERIAATAEQIVEQTELSRDEFVWIEIRSPEDLRRVRMAAMEEFLADYDAGLKDGRYIPASLPSLPFADGSFDLAVCSHFLFLYSEQLGEQFHEDAVLELCRVADEVRIFPVLALGGVASPHVVSTTATLKDLDCQNAETQSECLSERISAPVRLGGET